MPGTGTRGSILRHTIANLLGLGLPLVVAVFTIPVLIRHLGDERFGLLTLIWAVVGYFGLFDLGLGRALTQQLAVHVARNEEDRVSRLVATTVALLLALGVASGALIAAGAPWAVSLLKEVSDPGDTISALRVMGVAMPFVLLTSGLRGILEARFAFGTLNAIRIPMGLFTFLGPLAVVMLGSSRLTPIAWVLTLGRAVACVAHAVAARRDLSIGAVDRAQVRPLLASGGWMTVSNVVSPLMAYADRFIIGAVVSAGAVAFYTTPNEMITKIVIIPMALTAVLFPSFAQHVVTDRGAAWPLFVRAVEAVFLVTLPIALGLALFAREILTLWVGAPFAAESAPVLRLFAVGILFVCVAQVPFTLLQSANRARVTAIVHCAIFPVYVVVLWQLTRRFGLVGAATGWLVRNVVDTALMFHFGVRTVERPASAAGGGRALASGAAATALFAGAFLDPTWMRGAVLAAGLAFVTWAGMPLLRRLVPSAS